MPRNEGVPEAASRESAAGRRGGEDCIGAGKEIRNPNLEIRNNSEYQRRKRPGVNLWKRSLLMPVFEASQVFPQSLEAVFDFFILPANLVKVSPPELNMKLIDGPERLALGSRVTLDGRRWGISQRIVSEVIDFQPGVAFTDAQTKGPFRKWIHRHTFAAVPAGTEVRDRIEYEPPRGMLGLVATVARIEADLKWIFGFRQQQLALLLAGLSAT
jgi:ligand-binding SRPBCC domain-containing protein